MKKLLGIAAASVLLTATGTLTAQASVATPTWVTANSTATGDQDVASIATNRTGYVAVVWEDDRDSTGPDDNAHSEIYLRLFRNGTAVYEKKLSAAGSSGVTNWRHLTPDVGLDDKGNAVVVWADDPDGNGYYNIPYRVVNTAGTVTASGSANNSATGQQIKPRVAVDRGRRVHRRLGGHPDRYAGHDQGRGASPRFTMKSTALFIPVGVMTVPGWSLGQTRSISSTKA